MILDPTFGLTANRREDQGLAGPEDIFAATRDETFDSIEYVPLTADGFAFAQNYYIDYPLLFAHVLAPAGGGLRASVPSTLKYYNGLGTASAVGAGYYALHCLGGQQAIRFKVAGTSLSVDEYGVASLECGQSGAPVTNIFYATSIEPYIDDAFEVLTLRREVFD